ncbi:ParA family protein [Teredinibacter franksiae]|uniref:ParA family protein n=1 Tax=Teredinibacter franksiae TaxID=2761453 RepID=UPI001628A871|nr:ParA family protein [Teredinibacter franksiae]
MNQIFIANPKGGCGKTTIAAQLAGYFANQGKSVLLVDHDTQRSSSDWLGSRPDKYSHIELVALAVDQPVVGSRAEMVVHDMPAAWDLDHVADIIHEGDCVLIPILSSPTDIKACLRFIMGLYRSGVMESSIKIGIVANRAKTKTRYFQVLLEFLNRVELPLISSLRDTQNYVRAMDKGLTIFDLPPGMVSIDTAQWQPIIDWLNATEH